MGVNRGQEDSLAGDVSEYVEAIMRAAERDAAASLDAAEGERGRLIARARVEAAACRDEAVRSARAAAAERIARILDLRRAIERRMMQLAPTAHDQKLIAERMQELADALAGRADAIAQAGFGPSDRPSAAVADAPEPPADASELPADAPGLPADAPEPPADAPGPASGATGSAGEDLVATPANADGDGDKPVLIVTKVTPQYDRAHLHALRRAIAGAGRAELGSELSLMLESREAADAVLDDVFGCSAKPFPKWAAARQASAV